jgi:hypothetical protein
VDARVSSLAEYRNRMQALWLLGVRHREPQNLGAARRPLVRERRFAYNIEPVPKRGNYELTRPGARR